MTGEAAFPPDILGQVPGCAHREAPAAATAPATPASGKVPAARGRFARLPLLAGRAFIPLGLFARLPLARLTVGTLTLVTSASGSYALGALADRRGQRPVLLLAALLNSIAMVALILAVWVMGEPPGNPVAVLAAAFVSGASCPQAGPLAKVQWMALASRGTAKDQGLDLDAALSYESTADEVTFVLGPALVGILACLLAPWLPLALAVALTITLVPAFAMHRTHRAVPASPTPAEKDASGGSKSASRTLPAAVALPVLAMVCMETFFGSTQTALSSFSAGLAGTEAAGLPYAVMGLSSAVAALSVAYWPQRFRLSWRWVLCAGLMAALSLLLLLLPSSTPAMVAHC